MSESLFDQLFGGHEYRFGFFQAVRLLDLLLARGPSQRCGHGRVPEHEPIRFRSRVSLAFPPSELFALGADPEDPSQFDRRNRVPRRTGARLLQSRQLELTVSFMGLLGTSSVLPLVYTQLVLARLRRGDRALRDFLDLLGQRFLSFFYRAWAKHRPGIDREWRAYYTGLGRQEWLTWQRQQLALADAAEPVPAAPVGATPLASLDAFTRQLFSLIGLGTEGVLGRLSVSDESLLRYIPLFALRHHPAQGLRALLTDHLALADAQVTLRQFVPQEQPLPLHEQSVLGERHSGLGTSAVCGDTVVIYDSRFELVLGPLSRSTFDSLLPPGILRDAGPVFVAAVQLTRLFVGPELDFDVRLVLRAQDARTAVLQSDEEPPSLGGSLWLINELPDADLADSVFPSTAGRADVARC